MRWRLLACPVCCCSESRGAQRSLPQSQAQGAFHRKTREKLLNARHGRGRVTHSHKPGVEFVSGTRTPASRISGVPGQTLSRLVSWLFPKRRLQEGRRLPDKVRRVRQAPPSETVSREAGANPRFTAQLRAKRTGTWSLPGAHRLHPPERTSVSDPVRGPLGCGLKVHGKGRRGQPQSFLGPHYSLSGWSWVCCLKWV